MYAMTKEQLAHQDPAEIKIEVLRELNDMDLSDLCDAAESTVLDNSLSFNIGMYRTKPTTKESIETYWKGVLLVPERELIIGRIDGVIAASVQLIKPAPDNQTSAFCGTIDRHFVAPWARGHGLAKALIFEAEKRAEAVGLTVLRLSVRANLEAAISLYESLGYKRWGTLDKYEMVGGKMLAGHFYYKDLSV
jgi:RimJ/RimL family protein N-acetyltransferase